MNQTPTKASQRKKQKHLLHFLLFRLKILSSYDKTDARTAALTTWGQRNSCYSCWSSPINPNLATGGCDGNLKWIDRVTLQIQPPRKSPVLFVSQHVSAACLLIPTSIKWKSSLTFPLDILSSLIECRKIISPTLSNICFKVGASPGEPMSDTSKGNIVWYSVKLHYITCSVCKAPPAGTSPLSHSRLKSGFDLQLRDQPTHGENEIYLVLSPFSLKTQR